MASTPTKDITFDFFNISTSNPEELASLVEFSISNCTPVVYRTSLYRFHSYNILKLAGSNCIVGTAIKIITQGLPQRAKLAEPVVSDFELEVDEGIGIITAFLIDPTNKKLVFQRNGQGVRCGAFINLLEKVCKLSSVDFEPLLDLDAEERFKKMQSINAYHIRFATPSNSEMYKGLSAAYVINNLHKFGSSKCEIKYTIETQKRSWGDIVKEIKADAFGVIECGADKAIVTGKVNVDDEKSQTLDLINERLKSIVPVPFRGRSLHFGDLEKSITEVYMEKYGLLQTYFSSL